MDDEHDYGGWLTEDLTEHYDYLMKQSNHSALYSDRAELNNIEGIKCNVPQGAFYVFPDVSYYFGKSDGTTTINNSDDFCMYLLNSAHVACVAGDAFGNPECIRISYAAADEKLIEAIDRVKKQLAKLS